MIQELSHTIHKPKEYTKFISKEEYPPPIDFGSKQLHLPQKSLEKELSFRKDSDSLWSLQPSPT